MLGDQSYHIEHGNAIDILKSLNSVVHCVVTSPPYYKKRKYGKSKEEIGKSGSAEEFIASLCDIFDAVPLHDRGSVWVNLGDTRGYDSGLLMVPERFAMEMVKRGWKLVDHVVWAKQVVNPDGSTIGGCMIEPANRRLNGNAHEKLFRFVKTKNALDAWTDTCAVRIPRVRGDVENIRYLPESLMRVNTATDGRSLSNVWRFPTGQTRKAHYAVYPSDICERPIAMTCPMFVSPSGFIRERIIEMVEYDENTKKENGRLVGKYTKTSGKAVSGRCDTGKAYVPKRPETRGWTGDDNDFYLPGLVLDPFTGSGATGEAALRLGRSYLGIDLYQEFVDMSTERCDKTMEYIRKCGLDPRKAFC